MVGSWPALDWPQWRETAIALQLRTQIIGKVRLALTPWLNHSWHVPLYVSARGLTTSASALGRWDRAALECPIGWPRVPRQV
jgi:hypothetical protein